MEDVFTINKVRYINDSKATNVNATYYALESMKNPTVWIVGGVDKEITTKSYLGLLMKRLKRLFV